jgi:hypothetical protein
MSKLHVQIASIYTALQGELCKGCAHNPNQRL